MKNFFKHTLFVFLAFRAGDFVNIASGMWFVPKYVSSEEIGGVLPITSFATFLSLPIFALAMTVMKESSYLATNGEKGKIKSLLSGVFNVTLSSIAVVLICTAFLMPRFLKIININDYAVGFLVVSASFLGCVAPVWIDALQSLKRFKALSIIEFSGSIVRFLTMIISMPIRPLAGYFLGQASLPAFKIIAGSIALKRDLSVKAEPFWNKETVKRMGQTFIAILVYQSVPLFASMMEQTFLRTSLPTLDSAGFYMVSRFSDFLYYLTFPLLLVMFPYTASAAQKGESTTPYVLKCSAVTLIIATIISIIYTFSGSTLLNLLPNGEQYAIYAKYMSILILITALTSCQVFFTNAEVSAGRFKFLYWLIPLHLIYIFTLYFLIKKGVICTLSDMIISFAVISILRFLFSAIEIIWYNVKKDSRGVI